MHPSVSESDPRYPIGRFVAQSNESELHGHRHNLEAIDELPVRLSMALAGLNPEQLDTPYREGGWTVRQLVHHIADSHMHAYARLRFALTEDWPVIKPYDEADWARLADATTLPVEVSLSLLFPLNVRWLTLLNSLDEAAWERGYVHPENGRTTLASMTALYSWHGRHHTAHVLALRERMGW